MRRVNHGTITGTLSLFKILPLNGFNLIRLRRKLLRRRKGVHKHFLEPTSRPNQESFVLTIPWNLANLVKNYPGNHFTIYTPSIRNEWDCCKSSSQNQGTEPLQYCRNPAWMKNGWLIILWNAIFLSAKYPRPPWQMGEHLYERRFGEPFKVPVMSFGAMVEYHLISAKDQPKAPSIW